MEKGDCVRFSNALVLCDRDPPGDRALSVARRMTEPGGRVTLLGVVESSGPGALGRWLRLLAGLRGEAAERALLARRRAALESRIAGAGGDGPATACVVRQGSAADEAVRQVIEGGHDLLVKEAADDPAAGFRSLDMRLLRYCPCPLWLIAPRAQGPLRRIVAAVDTTSDEPAHEALNPRILSIAHAIAAREGASLDVLSLWHLPEEEALRHALSGMQAEIEDTLEATRARSADRLERLVRGLDPAVPVRPVHRKGRPADAIVAHAETERADLLVMGTLGRTGVAGLFIGNTAETILGRVPCSVVAIKPEGYMSPLQTEHETGRKGPA